MLWLKIQLRVSTSEITLKYKLQDVNGMQDIYSASGITLSLNVKGNVLLFPVTPPFPVGIIKGKQKSHLSTSAGFVYFYLPGLFLAGW